MLLSHYSNFILIVTMTRLLCAFLCLHASASFAFPKGCEDNGFGFHDPYVVFNDTGNQTYFLIQNSGAGTIKLERVETEDRFMSPKLPCTMSENNWSAFASDIPDVNFQCFSINGRTKTRINCREVLTICQYPRVKFALSNMGSYWVSTNKSQHQVIRESIKKGILLRW